VLSLTATERHVDNELKIPDGHTIYTQSDEEQYGPIAYEMSFAAATRRGYLANYKVVGMFSSRTLSDSITREIIGSLSIRLPVFLKDAEKNNPLVRRAWKQFSRPVTPDEIFKAWCVLECIEKEGKRRIMLFFNQVNESIRFNLIVLVVSQLKVAPIHLDQGQLFVLHSQTSFEDERKTYEAFESESREPVLVSSVDKLTMGVDFPSADMAVFVDPRNGEIRLPHSAGRVTRKDGNKKSVILIPGYLDEDGCLTEFRGNYAQAKQNACRAMLDTLYQLQKIDSRMIKVVTTLEHHTSGTSSIIVGGGSAPEVSLLLPSELTNILQGMTVKEAAVQMPSFIVRMNRIYNATAAALGMEQRSPH